MSQPPDPPSLHQRRPVFALVGGASFAVTLVVVLVIILLNVRHGPAVISRLATATPQPIQLSTQTTDGEHAYAINPPGPGSSCSQKTGQWSRDSLATTSFFCLNDGNHVQQAAGATTFAELTFDWPGHPFPAQYAARIKVSGLGAPSSCAGIGILRHASQGYIAYVCQNGQWSIVRYGPDGTGTIVTKGATTRQDAFEVNVIYQNHAITYSINTLVVAAGVAVDPTYTTTDVVTLDLDGQPGSAAPRTAVAAAVFANFVYTPLSAAP